MMNLRKLIDYEPDITRRCISFAAIVINIIFFGVQIVYFCTVAPYAPTKCFHYLFLLDMCFFAAWCGSFIKYSRKCLYGLDIIATAIVWLSMICVSFLSFNIGPFSMTMADITGYIVIILGVIGRIKKGMILYRAFFFYGIYVLLWTVNWYNSVY